MNKIEFLKTSSICTDGRNYAIYNEGEVIDSSQIKGNVLDALIRDSKAKKLTLTIKREEAPKAHTPKKVVEDAPKEEIKAKEKEDVKVTKKKNK